jgi:hypothetical protein
MRIIKESGINIMLCSLLAILLLVIALPGFGDARASNPAFPTTFRLFTSVPMCSDSAGVWIATDKRSYTSQEPVEVTICNGLPDDITIQAICSPLVLERQTDTGWVAEELQCPDGTTLLTFHLPSHHTMTVILSLVSPITGTPGPLVSEPATPVVFNGDLQTLPTPLPWQPGTPVREVPRGGHPTPAGNIATPPATPLLHIAYGQLTSGVYRLALRFEANNNPEQVVFSPLFLVVQA